MNLKAFMLLHLGVSCGVKLLAHDAAPTVFGREMKVSPVKICDNEYLHK